ncbi:hypothetical protein NP233_g7882 [Leucocoprinus birnbaumii]|uniref:Clathrin/coatomer adaptor adaptin-like N-terminal domain-containing protein n=1 Tax=Leucocoprinus birnbaumii TaxID=56174 RepID=A0AAD5YSC4_9AGAR|nr:hypothetical protein NP233_g7882 [Leucocoprinus birnbaumii]
MIQSGNDTVTSSAVMVLKTLVQNQLSSPVRGIAGTSREGPLSIVSRLARKIDDIRNPQARACVIWLVGQYSASNDPTPGPPGISEWAPDVLRKAAKAFGQEAVIVKLQIITLAAKLLVISPGDRTLTLLSHYVFSLARYDTSYDVRDRAKMIASLMSGILPTLSPGSQEERSGVVLRREQVRLVLFEGKSGTIEEHSIRTIDEDALFGSLSVVLGKPMQMDSLLPDWLEKGVESTLRDSEDDKPPGSTITAISSASIGQRAKTMASPVVLTPTSASRPDSQQDSAKGTFAQDLETFYADAISSSEEEETSEGEEEEEESDDGDGDEVEKEDGESGSEGKVEDTEEDSSNSELGDERMGLIAKARTKGDNPVPSTIQPEYPINSRTLDGFSDHASSSSLASSQDPDYIPTPYRHDSGIDSNGATGFLTCEKNTRNPFGRGNASSILGSPRNTRFEASNSEPCSLNAPSRYLQRSKALMSSDWLQQELPSSDSYTKAPIEAAPNLTTYGNGEPCNPGGITQSEKLVSRNAFFTNKDGLPLSSGTFINGAGTVGPHASTEAGDYLQQRARDADFSLTQKQKSKIIKAETKDNQRISKIIKKEAKVEKKALDMAIDELEGLQKFQKQADEAKAHTNHAKVLSAFKKQETAFLASRSRYESLQGQVNAETERLEAVRVSAKSATDRVAEKTQEVDSLRKMFGIDEREREVKLGELKETKTSTLWKV